MEATVGRGVAPGTTVWLLISGATELAESWDSLLGIVSSFRWGRFGEGRVLRHFWEGL